MTDDETINAIYEAIKKIWLVEVGRADAKPVAKAFFQAMRVYDEAKKF